MSILKLKKSSVGGKVPLVGDLEYGELAINYTDGYLYYKNNLNNVLRFVDSSGVSSIISTEVDQSFVNALNVDAATLNGESTYLRSDSDDTFFANTLTISAQIDVRPNAEGLPGGRIKFYNDSASEADNAIISVGADRSFFIGSIGSNPLILATNSTPRGEFTADGDFGVLSLTGAGDRMVIADSGGFLSTQTIPTEGATTSETAPGSPTNGNFWFDTTTGQLKVYYTDSDTSQWVVPAGAAGVKGEKGGLSSNIRDSDFTATAENSYFCNTTDGTITATLPSAPLSGDEIGFADYNGNFSNNSLFITPNGNRLLDSTGDLEFDVSWSAKKLIYLDSTVGWVFSP